MVAQTPRLALRRLEPADAAFLLRLLNEPSFLAHIGDRRVRSLEDAARYLREGPLASYARHGHGQWAVELRHSGETIGICGLLRRDGFAEVDLGYAFLPAYWGKGYAREAASAALQVARDLGLPGVIALVSPGNAASIRLLEALGFAAAGRKRLEADEVLVYRLSW